MMDKINKISVLQQQKKSQGLGSIVEEMESSPIISDDDTSDESENGDNASTSSSSSKTQRSIPVRPRRGSGLSLIHI